MTPRASWIRTGRGGSVPERGAFSSRVGGAGESDGIALGVVLDRQGVGVAEFGLDVDGMAHGRKLVANGEWYALLHREQVRDYVTETRRSDRLLDVHVEVDDVRKHLRRRLQDGSPAWGAYRHPSSPVAHDDGRTERVGDLVPRGGVERVARWLEAGPGDLVVEPDARPFGHHLAPENVAQGLRRADDVPLPVGHDEVRGVLPQVGRGRWPVVSRRAAQSGVGLHGRVVRRRLRKVYLRGFA